MTSALTRRGLVAAAPAALVAATAPTLAPASPDAALMALRGPYERTLAAMDVANRPHSVAENAYFKLKTTRPDLDERGLRKASGLIPAERAWLRAVDANHKIILQIAEQPAHTIEGLIFKARVSERENKEPSLVASIIDDLVALGGAHA